MIISSIAYSEFIGKDKEWILHDFPLQSINLLVGKNASGKSRLLSVIAGLANLISGQQREMFSSGTYDVKLTGNDGDIYRYTLSLSEKRVVSELLERNEKTIFSRDEEGVGTIFAEKEKRFFDFSIPQNVLAINTKRDKIQHPFLDEIFSWASTLKFYQFANSFGKDIHVSIPNLISADAREDRDLEVGKIQEIYSQGFAKFGDAFDESILKDFAALGYECEDVGLQPLDIDQLKGLPLATLFVKEKDIPIKTLQIFMSQGMFRALALVIELNYLTSLGESRTVLVDDVGEGLDFERSKEPLNIALSG